MNIPVRIILVKPSHPGNIGATARAMKTMGLSELYLVSPKSFPDPEATALATHAADILSQAVIVEDILQALSDIQIIYATSANVRSTTLPLITARTAAVEIVKKMSDSKIAILFGPENYGLNNADFKLCHYHIQIPTAENYHSLNLAAAVQIICYELLCAASNTRHAQNQPPRELATVAEYESYYQHLREALIKLKELDPNNPRQLMNRLREIYQRAQLDTSEIKILRGILKAIMQITNT